MAKNRKRKVVLIVAFLIVAGLSIWLGFDKDESPKTEKGETGAVKADAAPNARTAKLAAVKTPVPDKSKSASPTTSPTTKPTTQSGANPQTQPQTSPSDDKGEILEKVNINNMPFNKLIAQLAEWENRPIIPHKDILNIKITIYSAKPLPRPRALELIYAAIREKGFIAEYTDDIIYFKPIKEAKFGTVPTVAPNEPLATIANRSMIVQKFFKLKNYSPSQLQTIILPLVPEHGFVSADDKTKTLAVIDTVSNLLRIEKVITQIDIPETDNIVTKTFQLKNADPGEVVQLLRILLGDSNGKKNNNPSARRPRPNNGSSKSVVVAGEDAAITLIPDLNRKWIIAKATPISMGKIEEWIKRLDEETQGRAEHSLRKIEYVNVREVADQITRMLERMPGQEIRTSVLVQPLEQAGQIMIVGSKENREMVLKLIDEIDIPSDIYVTHNVKLKYADPDSIKEFIENLYQDGSNNTGGYRGYWYWRNKNNRNKKDIVKVHSYPSLKQVTVVATLEKMEKIKEQIAEWDKPINAKEVTPIIISLKNSDPVKMAELLSDLFSEEQKTQNRPWWYWGGMRRPKRKSSARYTDS